MPYKNIVFVKLEKRLFSDHRWYMMSEKAQLNYIRFLLFAAETYNRIPKDLEAIRLAFKTNQTCQDIQDSINEIKKNFPKFIEKDNHFHIKDFDEKTNYVYPRENPGKTLGSPKVLTDKEEDKDKEKDKEEDKDRRFTKPKPEEVTEYAKSISFNLDGSQFVDYYDARGWLIGKTKIKDWKACVRTWKRKRNQAEFNVKSLKSVSESIGEMN